MLSDAVRRCQALSKLDKGADSQACRRAAARLRGGGWGNGRRCRGVSEADRYQAAGMAGKDAGMQDAGMRGEGCGDAG